MRQAVPPFVRVAVLAALVWAGTTFNASAQSCLAQDACLLSPNRAANGRTITPNGCSVPAAAGSLGQFYGSVFTAACNQHDIDWGTFAADLNGWYSQSNTLFRTRMLAICQSRPELGQSCVDAANLFFFAVNTTQEARAILNQAQYLSSDCSACSGAPGAPSNLTVQVAASQVSFQWTASPSAASYALEVVQPPLGLIPTNSSLPSFVAAGVPNGQYQVRVRALNAAGLSDPSNTVDVVVGSAAPCVPPGVPGGVSGSVVAGTASVAWTAVPGATSYIVRAGVTPGGSELFNGNVGATTSVSAGGLPAGFRAFVRILAVNACGTSAPSADVLIGG
jgi:hypothetical protein